MNSIKHKRIQSQVIRERFKQPDREITSRSTKKIKTETGEIVSHLTQVNTQDTTNTSAEVTLKATYACRKVSGIVIKTGYKKLKDYKTQKKEKEVQKNLNPASEREARNKKINQEEQEFLKKTRNKGQKKVKAIRIPNTQEKSIRTNTLIKNTRKRNLNVHGRDRRKVSSMNKELKKIKTAKSEASIGTVKPIFRRKIKTQKEIIKVERNYSPRIKTSKKQIEKRTISTIILKEKIKKGRDRQRINVLGTKQSQLKSILDKEGSKRDRTSGSSINEQETTNTGYEAKELGTSIAKSTYNIAKDISEIRKSRVNKVKDIKKEVAPNKRTIQTGRYISPTGKRSLNGPNNSRIRTTHGFRRSEKIQKEDTSNTGYQVMKLGNKLYDTGYNSMVLTRKIRNFKTRRKLLKELKHTRKLKTAIVKKQYANKIKTTSKITSKIASVAVAQVKAVVGAAVSFVTSQVGLLIIIAIIPIIAIVAVVSAICGGSGGVSYTYIMADESVIVEYYKDVEQLNKEANEEIKKMAENAIKGKYKEAIVETSDINVNFQDIMAIVGVLKEQEYEKNKASISEIHQKFYEIRTKETVEVVQKEVEILVKDPTTGEYKKEKRTKKESEYTLHIYAEQFNFAKVANKYFSDDEKLEWANNLASSNVLDLYPDLAGMGVKLNQGTLTQSEIENILAGLPSTDVTRENVVALAESLVGKISYGWGSKWKEGDPAPTNLDCSGFVDYVYQMLGAGKVSAGGGGTYAQWDNSYQISVSEMQIGDIGFLKPPSQASDNNPNHVGIFVGYDNDGNMMFVHCQGGTGVVKTTADAAGFSYFRRIKMNYALSEEE